MPCKQRGQNCVYCYDDGSRRRDALKLIIGVARFQVLQSDGYNVYLYLYNKMVDINHICYLTHARAKFQYVAWILGDKNAKKIVGYIAAFYAKERAYREAGLNAIQTQQIRRSTSSLEIVRLLRGKMNVLLSYDHSPPKRTNG